MADEPLLDFNTLISRPAIVIDGTRFELFSADELSVLTSHRLSIWGRRIEAIDAGTDEAEGAELETLIDNVVLNVVVDMPPHVFASLTGANKRAIVEVFTALLLSKKLAAVEAVKRAIGNLPIGEMFFPASSDFTAERPNGGWLKRLLRWLGRI